MSVPANCEKPKSSASDMNGVKTEKVDLEYMVEVVGAGSKVLQCREIKAESRNPPANNFFSCSAFSGAIPNYGDSHLGF